MPPGAGLDGITNSHGVPSPEGINKDKVPEAPPAGSPDAAQIPVNVKLTEKPENTTIAQEAARDALNDGTTPANPAATGEQNTQGAPEKVVDPMSGAPETKTSIDPAKMEAGDLEAELVRKSKPDEPPKPDEIMPDKPAAPAETLPAPQGSPAKPKEVEVEEVKTTQTVEVKDNTPGFQPPEKNAAEALSDIPRVAPREFSPLSQYAKVITPNTKIGPGGVEARAEEETAQEARELVDRLEENNRKYREENDPIIQKLKAFYDRSTEFNNGHEQ